MMKLFVIVAGLLLLGAAPAYAQFDITTTALVQEIPNAGTTGTTANTVAKLTGAPATAVIAGTTDQGAAYGIVVAGAGTSGNAQIGLLGLASCVFDGATTAGDYVQLSSTVGGDCHDAGATYPSANGRVLGIVNSTNGGAGTYSVYLFSPQERSHVSLAGANSWTGSNTFKQINETAATLASGSCTGTVTIDQSQGTWFSCTSTGATTFNTSNVAANGFVSSFTLKLVNAGANAPQHFYLSNGSTEAHWPGGTQPTFSTSGTDLITCSSPDAGSNWYCELGAKGSS